MTDCTEENKELLLDTEITRKLNKLSCSKCCDRNAVLDEAIATANSVELFAVQGDLRILKDCGTIKEEIIKAIEALRDKDN